LWPEYWKLEELEAVKASIPIAKWNSQYMQNPTSEEGALIKREWWQIWESDTPPNTSYILQSYDTAFSSKETADYSAITTWGVFKPSDGAPESIILLDAKRGRWDFPELKTTAYDEYMYWQPDIVLVESQASGTPLTQELRMMGIPVVTIVQPEGRTK
jgi:phage terminase large subunit-like protein